MKPKTAAEKLAEMKACKAKLNLELKRCKKKQITRRRSIQRRLNINSRNTRRRRWPGENRPRQMRLCREDTTGKLLQRGNTRTTSLSMTLGSWRVYISQSHKGNSA